MTLDYQKVWNTMNDLEMVTSKICSAREILNSAIDALENHKLEKTETLLYAVDEFLQYYLQEFDTKFKDAWNETVTKVNQETIKFEDLHRSWDPPGTWDTVGSSNTAISSPITCDKDDPSSECKGAWNSFWEENYYPEEYKGSTVSSLGDDGMRPWGHSNLEYLIANSKQDKVVKWLLPVEESKDYDTDETEYFITFPDDLLEAANLNPGDEVEWVDQNDGNFLLRKVTRPLGMNEC